MRQYRITGGNRLCGSIPVSGSKNAALPIIAASILNGGECVIHNCPRITDVMKSLQILESIGCTARFEGNTLIINSSRASKTDIPKDLAEDMRSSIFLMGAMLGRFGRVKISHPGGCKLGPRLIDIHKDALGAMGTTIVEEGLTMLATADRLNGQKIVMRMVSVGATENVMLAAVMAEGETVIQNAAHEPEIVDLQRFLNGMGANVRGAGTDTIVIKGVKKLHSVEHTVIPDRIVAGTYLVAAAMTGSDLTVTKVSNQDLTPITARLVEMGCRIKEEGGTVKIKSPQRLKRLPHLTTSAHPGFPTDMQAQFVAALSVAKGTSQVKETIFKERNKHYLSLNCMKADISMPTSQDFVIQGVKTLQGATVPAEDLRGGAALILAGLAAEGETVVTGADLVERGYEDIEKVLSSAGANIVLEI